MMRKLRIFPGEQHPFADDPNLVPFEMPPRQLRNKGPLFVLPEGWEPMNSEVRQGLHGPPSCAYKPLWHHAIPTQLPAVHSRGADPTYVPTTCCPRRPTTASTATGWQPCSLSSWQHCAKQRRRRRRRRRQTRHKTAGPLLPPACSLVAHVV